MAEGWRAFLSAWAEFGAAGSLEYRELDDGRVLVLHSFRGASARSPLRAKSECA
jgi:hypothetical protein